MLSESQIQQIVEYFANKINYKFKNPDLLIQALTRKSAKGIHVAADAPDFESLEFIGDRALNLAITTHLCELYPKAAPGELQRYYEAYTRNTDASKRNGGPLYRVAKELDLETFILKAEHEDLEKNGLRGKISSSKKTKEGHLSDHLEAFIGALYQDSQYDIKLILQWVQQYWQYMGLNEDGISESSFGDSSVSLTAITVQRKIKQDGILLEAAAQGNLQNVKIALERGASITATDTHGQTALHHFAGYGNAVAITFILSTLELDVDVIDNRGLPALIYAIKKGAPDALEALLAAGASADIEVVELQCESYTALSLAAIKGHAQLIALLLKYGWHSISNEQIQEAIIQAKIVQRNNIESILQKSLVTKEQNKRMFAAAEDIIEHPRVSDLAANAIKKAIVEGANIQAKNIQRHTIFNLLKIMPVKIRFDLLGFILDRKLKLDDIDLTDISVGVTLSDARVVFPVYQQLRALKEANQVNEENRALIDRWLVDLKAEDDSIDLSLRSYMELLTITASRSGIVDDWQRSSSSSNASSQAMASSVLKKPEKKFS